MSTTEKIEPAAQRQQLLDAERAANKDQPRNFKDDALTDKVVHVEPDGTGPSPIGSLDSSTDRKADAGTNAS